MTDRDRLILEDPEKMCEYCCNFEKNDCTALCKLTMTLAYAEDYGGNCMFYNVPKEQIIVPPCKVDDTVYVLRSGKITEMTVKYMYISHKVNRMYADNGEDHYNFRQKEIGKTVFLNKEEAEKTLKEREG